MGLVLACDVRHVRAVGIKVSAQVLSNTSTPWQLPIVASAVFAGTRKYTVTDFYELYFNTGW